MAAEAFVYVENYFLARVISVERITPSMIRIRIGGEGLRGRISSPHADEWIRLRFPLPGEQTINLPEFVNGKWQTPEGLNPSPTRPYTVRNWDSHAAIITIDFVAHEGGVAADWAMSARPGDPIGLGNPGGRYRLPEDAGWILLVADITGLPAVGRILEELPADRRAHVHVEIPDAADQQRLTSAAGHEITWYHSFGKPETPTRLADIARAITLPSGPGYIWIAGEATAASDSRKHFRDILGFDKERITSIGYWILGQSRG